MKLRFRLFIQFFFFVFIASTVAQTSDTVKTSTEMLRVYIDCDYCDYQFMVQNILFVDFVRDPYVSQVQVIISTEHTAAGGHKFNVRFIGREKFSGMEHTLFYHSMVSESEDQQRRGLTQVIKMGLMPYLSQTALAPDFEIRFRKPGRDVAAVKLDDRWDHWIFRIGLGGGLEAEEQRNSFKITSNIRANRITEQWRFGMNLDYEYEEENIKEDEGGKIKSILEEKEWTSEIVKSVSNHWSAGIFSNVYATTYRNIDLGMAFSTALQYNIFPWKESAQRILAVAYHVGIRSFRYIEETLYNKLKENRFYEALAF